MLIDLGTRVGKHDWIVDGDLWTSQQAFLKASVTNLESLDKLRDSLSGYSDYHSRDHEAEKAAPIEIEMLLPSRKTQAGRVGYAKDGSLYFRWPKDANRAKRSEQPWTIQTHGTAKNGVNAVSIACSNIIIRNLTVKYAGNDGINIHGDRRGILGKACLIVCGRGNQRP